MVTKSANLVWNQKETSGGWVALRHALQCALWRRELHHGGGGYTRGKGSAEVGKSVRRRSWEGERVTSSGVDFTAPVALILTSGTLLGQLHLDLCKTLPADDGGTWAGLIIVDDGKHIWSFLLREGAHRTVCLFEVKDESIVELQETSKAARSSQVKILVWKAAIRFALLQKQNKIKNDRSSADEHKQSNATVRIWV